MIIRIETSGGFAGIAAARPRQVETPEGSELAHAFDPDALAQIADAPCRDCPDGLRYRITIVAGGAQRCFEMPESQIPPELLDLIDRI